MENVHGRVDIRVRIVKLLTQWEGRYGAEAMIAKSNFHTRSVFSENLVAIELRKLEVKFDIRGYVHPRRIQDVFVQISPRIHSIAVPRKMQNYVYRY